MKPCYVLFILFACLALLPASALAQTFSDQGAGAGVNDTGGGQGIAWGDYDNDGDLDLYLANNGANRLYRNNGNGTFTDVAGTAGVADASNSRGVAWGDFDSDGDLDLYVANNGANRLYRNDGGTFTDVAGTAGVADAGDGVGVAWGDYDSDGDLDLYLVNFGGTNRLYRNNGNGTFTEVASSAGVADTGNGYACAWGDYDNDGDLDLYIARVNAANRLYRNDGNGSFSEVAATANVADSGFSRSAAWGDYDNDGDLDLYLVNGSGQANRLYRNDNGTFTDIASTAGVGDTGDGYGAAWGDYDNDGDLDLYVVNSGSQHRLYRNNGAGSFTDVAASEGITESGAGGFSAAWADYDGDGDLDVYVAISGAANRLYRNAGNGNRWLHVKLAGTGNNRNGIGARVTAVTGSTRQRRDVESGGSGVWAQGSLPVEFGFGSTTTVDSLIVRWPGGVTVAQTNVSTNQVLTVTDQTTPAISLSATSISAGAVTKGSPGTATFTVTNTGGGTLSVTGVASSNPMFTASPNTLSLAASAAGTVTVTFTPTKVGWEQSALTISHNAGGSSVVTVNGIGKVTPPTGSLNNTKIAYNAYPGGNGEIYTMNIDGTNQTRLTSSSTHKAEPSWSPDGTKIAFTSGNVPDIYTMNADGTDQTPLTTHPGTDNEPSWSPDGTRIAFYSDRDGKAEIYVMNANGTDQRRLTSNSAEDRTPSWSPDGTKITFYSDRDGNPEIYVMNADGTDQRRLTSNSATDTSPAWSPDGTTIAFTTTRDGNAEIYVMNADGTDQRRLTSNSASDDQSSWSPDGTKIAFVSYRDATPPAIRQEIYVMNANGTDQTRLTNAPSNLAPSWSPFFAPAPVMSLSATSLSFGNVEKGQSGQQTVRIRNTGAAALSVSSVTTNAPFSASPSGSQTVNAGDSVTVTVTFSPTSVGARTDTLRITHNAAGGPSKIALSGTGIDTTPPAAPASLTSAVANNTVTLTWQASPESDLSYYAVYRSLVNNFTPTSADSIARVNRPATTYTNTGLSAGTYYFRIAAVDSAGNRSSPSAQASVTLTPVVSLAPVPLHVGNVSVGTPVTHFLTVTNTGTAALVVSGMRVSGADSALFKVDSTSFTVEAGSSAQTVVTFTPTSAGTRRATLSIFHNAAGGVTTLDLSGTGIDVIPPTVPSGLTATPGPNQVTLTWTGNGETDLSHYVIYRSTNNGFTPASTDSIGRVNRPGTTFTNTGLSAGTYYFRIAAVDSSGNKSSPSPQTSATLAPGISLSPSPLAFGSVSVGGSSTASLTVLNPGTDTLRVTQIQPSDGVFTVSSTTLTVPPGQSGTVTVKFAPGVAGDRTATLTISHNAPGGSSTVTATGTGAQPGISLSASPLDFGDVLTGQTKSLTFTVSNPGNAPLTVSAMSRAGSDSSQFMVSSPSLPLTVAPGAAAQTVTVTFAPASAGTKTASVSLVHNAPGSPSSVALKGNGVAQPPPKRPVFASSPTSLDFGKTPVNQRKDLTLTVSNTGDTTLVVTGISSGDPAFAPSQTSFSVPAGQSQGVTVGFTPSATGVKSAALTITHNAGSATVPVTGEGVTPILSLSAPSIGFGDVEVGKAATRELFAQNTGSADLSVTVSGIVGADSAQFRVTPETFTLAPGAPRRSIPLVFAPTGAGDKQARLTLTHNAAGGSTLISLTGRGTSPATAAIAFSPAQLSFGDVQVGQSASLTLTVTNSGTLALSVSRIASNDPQFTVSDSLLQVPAGGSRPITVKFTPTSAGGKSASLSFTHNAPGGNSSVPMTGNGVTPSRPAIAVSPDSLAFGGVPLDSAKVLTFTVSNPGTAPLIVSGIALSGADTLHFRVSPVSFRVDTGRVTQAVTVTFQPRSAGVKSTTLTLAHNTPGTATVVRVSGLGVRTGTLVYVSDVSAAPGQAGVVASVSVDSARGIAGGAFTIGFDPSLLTPRQVRGSALADSAGLSVVSNLNTAGQVRIALAGATGMASGSGPLVNLTFDVSAGAAQGTYDLSLQAALNDEKGRNLPVTARKGVLTVKGTPVPAPGFSVSASTLTFDSTRVGAASQKTLTISNPGTGGLSITRIAVSGPDSALFRASPDTATVAPGQGRTVTVTFAPVSPGLKAGFLTVFHSAAGGPATIPLAGMGVGVPGISLLDTLVVVDSTRVGVTSQKTFTISNPGTDSLLIAKIGVSGADSLQFRISSSALAIARGGRQAVTVTFAPTSPGLKSALLTLTHNAAGSPHRISLRGVGVPAGFDTVEVAGPVTLDLNPLDGDQGQKVRKGVRAGSTVTLQFFVRNAPPISGYTVRLALDTTVVRPGTFTPSDFIPGRVALPPALPAPDSLDVGTGSLTGATGAGDGLLGTVTFQVTEKFHQETRIVATRVTFSQPGGIRQGVQQRVLVTLSAEGKEVTPDFNGDGIVDFDDFFLFAGVFGTRNPDFDLTGDGFVGFDDFFAFAAVFGQKV